MKRRMNAPMSAGTFKMKTIKVGEHEAPLKDMKKFIAALRSGKFKQTISRLQDSYGACCLGVGCLIFIPKEKLELDPRGFVKGATPAEQGSAPVWLTVLSSDVEERFGANLATLNDRQGFTFKEIAHVLDLIYIKGVM